METIDVEFMVFFYLKRREDDERFQKKKVTPRTDAVGSLPEDGDHAGANISH
jgi:hypothetical protein